MNALAKEVQDHWLAIGPLLTLETEQDYVLALGRLDLLLAEVGEDETHPLYGLLDTLGTLVHAYEEEHEAIPDVSGSEALRFLMEEHLLSEADLPELGPKEEVRAILTGEQELHVGQIRVLAERCAPYRGSVIFMSSTKKSLVTTVSSLRHSLPEKSTGDRSYGRRSSG